LSFKYAKSQIEVDHTRIHHIVHEKPLRRGDNECVRPVRQVVVKVCQPDQRIDLRRGDTLLGPSAVNIEETEPSRLRGAGNKHVYSGPYTDQVSEVEPPSKFRILPMKVVFI
jgi:hypothetical protein